MRYRITIKGWKELKNAPFSPDSGILFLPNHPSETDPLVITSQIWPYFRVRPLVVEYIFETPVIRWIITRMRSLAIPSFEQAATMVSKQRALKALSKVERALKSKEAILLYPAGRLQHGAHPEVGGASAIEHLIKKVPNVNIVLVRIKGLWGSRFSRAQTGKTPDVTEQLISSAKTLLLNLLFLAPRRKVEVEFFPLPQDFPREGSRSEINRYLENFYAGAWSDGQEPLQLVRQNFWSKRLPEVTPPRRKSDYVTIDQVPEDIKMSLLQELARLTHKKVEEISLQQHLFKDLALDSLEMAQLQVYIAFHLEKEGVELEDVATVEELICAAATQKAKAKGPQAAMKPADWGFSARPSFVKTLSLASTLQEAVLYTCDHLSKQKAMADEMAGMLSYRKVKFILILLARFLRRMPGQQIGVLLPATTLAPLMTYALLLAKKTPVMLNWTLGAYYLKDVVETAQISTILSSWKFLDRLSTVDLTSLADQLMGIEDIRCHLKLRDYLNAYLFSLLPKKMILRLWNLHTVKSSDIAALLFTSGTEGRPKGVPLTHENLLSNMRAALSTISLTSDDTLLGFLPPFHSFGFTVATLLPLACGLKVAYSPDPTDGAKLVHSAQKWGVTMICGSPTFIKNILQMEDKNQLSHVHLFVSGAEKAPHELFTAIKKRHSILLEGYGTTECSPIITFTRPEEAAKGVGRPLPGIELAIVDPESHIRLAPGKRGLILVHGPSVFNGYWGGGEYQPFVQLDHKQWYNTGDLGFIDEQGYLYLEGRLRRFVKIGGEMVNLSHVEEVLIKQSISDGLIPSDSTQGTPLAVVAIELPSEKPLLCVATTFALKLDAANAMLKKQGMSNLIKLQKIVQLPQIPQLGTGKVDYQQIIKKYFE